MNIHLFKLYNLPLFCVWCLFYFWNLQ